MIIDPEQQFTAIRACAIGANVLPGRLATFHFTPSTTLAEHNFLFATPKLFKSGHPERTWHLTVRTWRPTAGLITAGEVVDTFQNNFAETAQRMPGFIMYFGCCIEELEEESAFFVNIFETEEDANNINVQAYQFAQSEASGNLAEKATLVDKATYPTTALPSLF